MSFLSKNSKNHDVLILGSNLENLLLAECLHQMGRQVCLLEPSERICPIHRPLHGIGTVLPPDLSWIPYNQETLENFNWLKALLQSNEPIEYLETSPLHFDSGKFKSFVGFGDRQFASHDEMSFYLTPSVMITPLALSNIAEQLSEKWLPQIQVRKQATQFLIKDGRMQGVVINGEDTWTANDFIASASPSDLLELIPTDSIEGKHRTRIAKATTWTTISLHLQHQSPVSMERGLHLLYGSGSDFEPALGRFWPVSEDGHQFSVWMTWVPKELSQDTDSLGQAIKNLKRQIKRPFENAFENLRDEKLVTREENHGHMSLKTKDAFRLPEISNLTLTHPLLSHLKGPVAALDVAQKASALFQSQSMTVPIAELKEEGPAPISSEY